MSDKSAENLRRIRAWDAEWDESKHSRADNGQFTSGGGGGGAKKAPKYGGYTPPKFHGTKEQIFKQATAALQKKDPSRKPPSSAAMKKIKSNLNHSLWSGETDRSNVQFEGYDKHGNIRVSYDVSVQIPVGVDPETGQQEYEYDTEYRESVFDPKTLKEISYENYDG